MEPAEYRRKLKSAHLCIRCKDQDVYTLNGRSYCADCCEKRNEYRRKDYAKNKEKYIEANRRKTEKRRKNGKCPRCGKSLPINYTYKSCNDCRKYDREKHKRMREKNGAIPFGTYGICHICKKRPWAEGKKMCNECYEKAVKHLAEVHRTNDNKNSVWRKDENLRRKGR